MQGSAPFSDGADEWKPLARRPRKLALTGLEGSLAHAHGHTPTPKAVSFSILKVGIPNILQAIPSLSEVAVLGRFGCFCADGAESPC